MMKVDINFILAFIPLAHPPPFPSLTLQISLYLPLFILCHHIYIYQIFHHYYSRQLSRRLPYLPQDDRGMENVPKCRIREALTLELAKKQGTAIPHTYSPTSRLWRGPRLPFPKLRFSGCPSVVPCCSSHPVDPIGLTVSSPFITPWI